MMALVVIGKQCFICSDDCHHIPETHGSFLLGYMSILKYQIKTGEKGKPATFFKCLNALSTVILRIRLLLITLFFSLFVKTA